MGKAFALMAEDDPQTRASLYWLLVGEGFDVAVVENGEEALHLLTQVHPDLILTDLLMPRVDGLELIRRVRSKAEYTETPIVALSAAGAGYLHEGKAVGATAVLRQPEDILSVVETINRALPDDTVTLKVEENG